MPEHIAAFIREYIAAPLPVAKTPPPVYDAPWKPTEGDREPPF